MMEIINSLITWDYFALLMFPAIFLALFAGFPVAFSLMGLSLIFGLAAFGDKTTLMLAGKVWDIANNYVLAAVPLFVFMGCMLSASGIANRLFEVMLVWTGRLRGGLAFGTIIMCTIFAAATGIIGASEVVIGLLAIPVMLKQSYNKGLICGTICAGGALGSIIPPSVPIVVLGPTAGLPVGRLLVAAIGPGFLLATLYCIYILIRCYFRPQDGPGISKAELNMPLKKKLSITITSLIPPLILIFAVMGTIITGLAAPTEAASLGAFGSLVLCLLYNKLTWSYFKDACFETLRISSMILLVLTGGSMYTSSFIALGGSDITEKILLGLNFPPTLMVIMLLLLALLSGFLLDHLSMILIFIPIFVPIVKTLGFDPIWFSILFMIIIQTSYLTPPMAPSIFYLKGIVPPEIKIADMFRGVIPYIAIQVVGIAICISFPQIILYLPNLMVGF